MNHGPIDSSGVKVCEAGATFRGTLSLTSSAANRAIELSINGGQDYFTPQLDVEEENNIGVVIKGGVTNIRFTGDEGDIWRVIA